MVSLTLTVYELRIFFFFRHPVLLFIAFFFFITLSHLPGLHYTPLPPSAYNLLDTKVSVHACTLTLTGMISGVHAEVRSSLKVKFLSLSTFFPFIFQASVGSMCFLAISEELCRQFNII